MADRNSSARTNIYVENFDDDLTEGELCKLFATYGTITSCKIAKDAYGQSKGHGFVNFLEPSMAANALQNLKNHVLENGRVLGIAYFQNKQDRIREKNQKYYEQCADRNLFVGNLDESIDDEQLKEAFAQHGTISSAKVMMNGGHSKGYGFVCFESSDEARDAIHEMNGKELGSKMIYVDLAGRKPTNPEPLYPNTRPRFVRPQMYGTTRGPASYRGRGNSHSRPSSRMSPTSDRWVPLSTRLSNLAPTRVYSPPNDRSSESEEDINTTKDSVNNQEESLSNHAPLDSDEVSNDRDNISSKNESKED